MRTLTEKFRAIQESKFTKAQFLRDARLELPNLVTQHNSYEDAVSILKGKGLLFEAETIPVYRPPVAQVEDMFSIDSVERGIDYELEKIEVKAPMMPDEEEFKKAKSLTLKNLLKNPNFYIDKLANVKSNKNRTDLMVPATKANTVDKANSIVKVQLKEAVKNLIYRVLETRPSSLIEQSFAPGLDLQLAYDLHKAIVRRLRETGNTFEQEWGLASGFGFFVNNVGLGKITEEIEIDKDTIDRAKEALESLLEPETLANPELMDQFLQTLRDEFMTTPELFNSSQELAESKTKLPVKKISTQGYIR